MNKLRIRYSKTGKAKYISHLDLMATMQRALIRAGVNLLYSEGFNPHPYICVALPASVGVDSICELADVAIAGGCGNDLSRCMPEGLEILSIYKSVRKFTDIKWLRVEVYSYLNQVITDDVTDFIQKKFHKDSFIIAKKTKRSISSIDIAPHIKQTSVTRAGDECLKIDAIISAQNPTVSHKDIVKIIESDNDDVTVKICKIDVKRIELYDANMLLFK